MRAREREGENGRNTSLIVEHIKNRIAEFGIGGTK